jgi:hypothetical protein
LTDEPNQAHFSVNENANKYTVRFHVVGSIDVEIEADNMEEARRKAEDMADDDDFGLELTDVTDVHFDDVHKVKPMYRVIRDGRMMQVSRLLPGDEPREPTRSGF